MEFNSEIFETSETEIVVPKTDFKIDQPEELLQQTNRKFLKNTQKESIHNIKLSPIKRPSTPK